jgi:RNA-directed DNA polymerase
LGRSIGLDATYVGGPGQRGPRRARVQLDGPSDGPAHIGGGLETGSSQQRSGGGDGISIARFKARASHYLAALAGARRDGSYQPLPARRVRIPKGKGKTRPLGIAAVKDRIVQAAVKMVLEPIFAREFLPGTYGLRPGRGCKDALREVDRWLKAGYPWGVDGDLESSLDTSPKGALRARVAEKVSDGPLLDLLQRFLDQEILDGMEQWAPVTGVPPGAVRSPLLSNLYLPPLDCVRAQTAAKAIRYCDDLVILGRTQAEAATALDLVRGWTAAHGLRLQAENTRIVDASRGGSGVTFLGYRFARGQRYVRRQGLKALRDQLRHKTGRTRGGSLEEILAELNPMLRGWFGYCKHARFPVFRTIDSFVRRRLRAILRQREKRPGCGMTHRDHKRWPHAFFAAHGLFPLHEAYGKASQSR